MPSGAEQKGRGSSKEFLDNAKRLFDFKNAVTDALVEHEREMPRLYAQERPSGRYLPAAGILLLTLAATAVATPATAFFVAAKAMTALFGIGMAATELANAGGPSFSIRVANSRRFEALCHDADNERSIAGLAQQVKFYPKEVQGQFARSFAEAAQKRAHASNPQPAMVNAPAAPAPAVSTPSV